MLQKQKGSSADATCGMVFINNNIKIMIYI